MALTVERYAVYWVDLDPVRGSEMTKRRPAVVVSDKEMNTHLETVVVCPLTTRIHENWPSRIQTAATGRITPAEAAALRHTITVMYGVLTVNP